MGSNPDNVGASERGQMSWIVYAVATAFALAAADFLVKLAAGRLSSSLAMLLYGKGIPTH